MAVPETFRENTLALYGEAGADWLLRIPELLEQCLEQWSLSLGSAYSDASYSYVVRVERNDGTPAALKLSFPGEHTGREAQALRAFAGRGAVLLIADNAEAGAMLLQRAEPGHPLALLCEHDDIEATSIAASLVRELAQPVPIDRPSPTVEEWRRDLQRLSQGMRLTPAVTALASDALAIAAELTAFSSPMFLLHGDLHQLNILAAGEEWLCIDPVGIVGERECEIAPLILNPLVLLRGADLFEISSRRLSQLIDEAGLDRRRAWAWTFVRTVVAILWSFEDHGHAPPEWVVIAQFLRRRIG